MSKIKNSIEAVYDPLTNESMHGFNQSIYNALDNNNVYWAFFSNLALNLFEYENLPETMDAEFLELCLFEDGKACFIKDPVLGPVNLRYAEIGKPNIYNKPLQIDAYSNDYHRTVNKEDFVIVRNNIMYIPTILYVNHFARIVTDIEGTLRVNLKAQKTPVTFTGSEEQILTLKNIYQKYEGNQPYIFAYENLEDALRIGVLKTDAPFLADKLQVLKEKYKAEFLSFIGVNTADEKKERLLEDEVNANNQFISLNFESMLSMRQKAVKEFNEKFGYNVVVKPKVQSMILNEDKFGEEGAEDGTIYDEPRSDGE